MEMAWKQHDIWFIQIFFVITSWHGNAFCTAGPLSTRKGPLIQGFDLFLVVTLNNLLNKQSSSQWSEILWHWWNLTVMLKEGKTQTPSGYHSNVDPIHQLHIGQSRQQTSLAPCWPNVDPIGPTLAQHGPNMPCYLGVSGTCVINTG